MIGQSLRVTGKFTAFSSEGAISTSATGLRMNAYDEFLLGGHFVIAGRH